MKNIIITLLLLIPFTLSSRTLTSIGNGEWDRSECVTDSLSVELAFLEADLVLGSLNVRWATLSEINNDYFEIEATTDGTNWQPYLRIDGAGNSTRFSNYAVSFPYDNSTGYVRLKQTDFDGSSTYSFIIFVQSSSFNVPRSEWLNVFNIKGQSVDFEYQLDPGTYIVQIESGYFKIIVK